MKCLVVDDSPAISNLIKTILISQDHEVVTAANGLEALDKYHKFKPDIVTLDLTMPIMDGYETLKRLMALDKDANIIMLTASDQTELLQRCMERGAKAFLEKPFSKDMLLSLIKSSSIPHNNHRINLLFSLISNKIKETLTKICNCDVKVILGDLDYSSATTTSSFKPDKIMAVSEITQKPNIEITQGVVGYITEIGGQQNGAIISSVKKEELYTVIHSSTLEANENMDACVLEFFNIINTKILSEIANATHLILNSAPVRLFDRENDKIDTSHDLTRAKFEIMINNNVRLESIVLFNMNHLFKDGF